MTMLLDLARAARSSGLRVVEVDGWQTRTRKEDFLLPSLTLSYDTSDDWVFRFAAAKVIA